MDYEARKDVYEEYVYHFLYESGNEYLFQNMKGEGWEQHVYYTLEQCNDDQDLIKHAKEAAACLIQEASEAIDV